MTRRRLFGTTARLAALAAAASVLPPSVRRMLAQEVETPTKAWFMEQRQDG